MVQSLSNYPGQNLASLCLVKLHQATLVVVPSLLKFRGQDLTSTSLAQNRPKDIVGGAISIEVFWAGRS